MPTTLLYLTDSYLHEFDAHVREIRGQEVILDSTAFYPGGGGQPPDKGKLLLGQSTLTVTELRKEGDEILHKTAEPIPSSIPSAHGALDWNLRYAHMRHHTALHILSGFIYHEYASLVTGGQIYPNRARLDFDLDDLSPQRVARIEEEANRIVQEAHPVLIHSYSREEATNLESLLRTKVNLIPPTVQKIRVVEIKDFDTQADGGTHVNNTKEVGRIRVTKTQNKGRLNRRIEIVLEPSAAEPTSP